MTGKKALRSLRFYVLFLIGSSLAVFILIFFLIYTTGIPRILLQAEDSYLRKQLDVVQGIFDAAGENTFMIADDMAVWDETVLFAQGKNPDYMSRNWPEGSALHNYRFNLLIIKDSQGNDLHVEFYDYIQGKALPEPEGFSASLAEVARRVLAKTPPYGPRLGPDAPIRDWGEGGIVFYRDVPYFIACMPVMETRENGEAVGTLITGTILNNEYFRNITHYKTVDFTLLPVADTVQQQAIARRSESLVTTALELSDTTGQAVWLIMSDTRQIYSEGRSILGRTTFMLITITLLCGFFVYQVLARYVLRPVGALRHDLDGMERRGGLDGKAYGGTEEFAALCASINSLLQRLNQSTLSLTVLHGIVNGLDAYIYATDPESGEILFINEKMRQDLGLDDDVVGKTCWQVLEPGATSRCAYCKRDQLLVNPKASIVWEYEDEPSGRFYKKTETLIDWLGGKKAHLQLIVDMTQVKATDRALKQRMRQQELMAQMAGSFISGAETSILIGNALKMVGEFMNVNKILMVGHDQTEKALHTMYEWFADTYERTSPPHVVIPFAPGSYEYDAFIRDKKSVVAHGDITALPDDFALAISHGIKAVIGVPLFVHGRFWGMLSINQCDKPRNWSESDIQLAMHVGSVIAGVLTRAETEDNLVRMSSLVNSAPQFISFATETGALEYVNPGGIAMLGFSEQELKEKGMAAFFDEPGLKHVLTTVFPRIQHDGGGVFDLPVHCASGEERYLSFTAFKTDFKSAGIGAIATDITKERELTTQLVQAKELAEQSSHAKSDFLSRMSHEMRTPLNAIIGMTSIANAADDIEKKQYCLSKIDEASVHLLGVINDILDMSKIEANKFELSFTEFAFEKMLHRVLNVVNFRVEEKNQTLLVDIGADMPAAIESDEQRLAQVIANLLSNAVKFTPESGAITVKAEKLDEEDGICTLRIAVSDTGIGISPENQARLFTSFEQADGGIARKFGGTGLGLVISKNIVEMMGGSIWIESEENKGATFVFTIKARIAGRKIAPLLRPDVNWRDLRLLAVDDAPEVLEYFKTLSATVNLHCEVAPDGETACRMLEESDPPYNIVFVDWKMPGMDGLELTRRIKARSGSETVVIMISATQKSDIESEAHEAGVDRFLPKPLFSSMIVDCINECLAPEQRALRPVQDPAGSTPSLKQTHNFAQHRILLAEDIEVNREIVLALLEPSGIQVECAENGQEAIDKFKAAPERYDMIFMDIHMPEVDGYEATRRIRALDTPKAASIPIVAMTANVFREDIERCRAAGMNDHVGKPIDMDDVFKMLAKWLQ